MSYDFKALLDVLRMTENRDGLRSKDIAKQWGCSQEKAVKLLGIAKDMGLVRATKVTFTDLSGRETKGPGYVLEVIQ